ncbi:gamma-glutamyltransferase [Anaeroselena agilis]|uniref:Glutathione hydrolase proenzyme n=1 Tax=Anaeroselena agilis TaxID=3063788 RepID=A0ABU3P1V0_9FIRM|nr:gamma-glutamyltransferase [Selenomonadales bacterium 4137-cl]
MKGKKFNILAWLMIAVFTVGIVGNCSLTAYAAEKRDFIATHGMVAAAHPLAAQAGVEVLKQGGNAFDAAIATAFMLNVVEPNASGMGGGGFAIVYVAKEKKTYMVDYREMAPAKAAPDMYALDEKGKVKDNASVTGYYASAVPGMLRGMEMIHQKFATLKWAELMAPAIAQAEAGLPVSKNLSGIIGDQMSRLEKYSPSREWFHNIYFKDGIPLQAGDVLRNPELTESLKKVAAGGADVFYKGEIADKLAAYYAKNANGWITKADLAAYKAKLREPVKSSYRGYDLVTVPTPSSGGLTLANILNIMENFDVAKMGRTSTAFHHTFIEAQKLAYADRGRYMADSDFVNVPMAGLVSKKYAAERAKMISPDTANNGIKPGDPGKYESGSTTSFSIIDKDGNMITITQTINDFLGACVVPDGTGILMNDEMDDFVTNNPASVNAPAPGKRPLSSMSPTIVLKDGKPFMTLGTPGGPRIITTVSQIIIDVIDFKMDLQTAINDPRMYNPNASVAQLEKPIDEATVNELMGWGHKVNLRPELSLYFGGAQGIMILPDGRLHGAADPRRLGQAFGY